jgi:hypothetical protein
MIDCRSRPQPGDDVERLVQHLTPSPIRFLAEIVGLAGTFPGTDPQHHTTTRQPVQ